MLGPRKRPTDTQAGETARPTKGSPTRVWTRQAARSGPDEGTPNSTIPIPPPGLTTRASSRIVAATSST
jgi:hypothetical protein